MYPIIVSPHKFGIKDEKDRIFVPLMLDSLRKTNLNTDIYFPNPNAFPLDMESINDVFYLNDKIEGLEELRKIYVHLSTNPADFELACIERFFILRHIAKNFGIEKFFTVETDCLVLSNFNDEFIKNMLNSNSAYLTDNTCISTGFITLEFLNSYCDGVLTAYGSNKVVEYMQNWYADYIANKNLGGICDMTFCSAMNSGWLDFEVFKTLNFCEIHESNGKLSVYDNFCIKDSFMNTNKKLIMSNSIYDGYAIKKYYHDEQGYYVKFEEDEQKVYLNSIHAQGNGKKLMGLLYVKQF